MQLLTKARSYSGDC